ncbi:MAG TPA: hypothetical protein VHP38_13375 [Ruminiclostridium sp.]|nr:hypothetical protein [Ruminiclostridium sp.]
MEYFSRISLGAQVSFVLCLIDDYTGRPADSGSYRIEFKYYGGAPVHKQDGFVVFCGLAAGDYEIFILSEKYHNERTVLHVTDGEEPPVVYISLRPRPSYSFSPEAALLRMTLVKGISKPVKGASVKVKIISAEAMKGKIAKVPVKKGDSDFYISSATGRLKAGDQFYLEAEGGEDVIAVEKQLDGLRHYQTKHPFLYDHDRGNPIMPIMETLTDDRGEAVVYFRSLPVKYFDARATIVFEGQTIVKEVKMEEGRTIYLKKLRF